MYNITAFQPIDFGALHGILNLHGAYSNEDMKEFKSRFRSYAHDSDLNEKIEAYKTAKVALRKLNEYTIEQNKVQGAFKTYSHNDSSYYYVLIVRT